MYPSHCQNPAIISRRVCVEWAQRWSQVSSKWDSRNEIYNNRID